MFIFGYLIISHLIYSLHQCTQVSGLLFLFVLNNMIYYHFIAIVQL